MSSSVIKEIARWLVSPKFREEGPPSYLQLLLSNDELSKTNEVHQVGYLIMLGYRPATILGLISAFVQNGNQPLYGAELGRELETYCGLQEGSYTKGRQYNDRLGKILGILSRMGVIYEVPKTIGDTQKTTTAYKLEGRFFQLAKWNATRNGLPLVTILNPPSSTFLSCEKDGYVAPDESAKYCPYCGASMIRVCSNCGKRTTPQNQYCIYCGARIVD